MEQRRRWPSAPDGHNQRVGRELHRHRRLHRSPHDALREQIDHGSHVQLALTRPDVGDVGDPFLIRRGCDRLPIKHIWRDRVKRSLAWICGMRSLSRAGHQRRAANEAHNVLPATDIPCVAHIGQELSSAIGVIRRMKPLLQCHKDRCVVVRVPARRPCGPRVEATARDPEHLALHRHRPDPSVFRYEAELHVDFFEKKTAAFFRWRTPF